MSQVNGVPTYSLGHDFDSVVRTEYLPLVSTAWAIVGSRSVAEEIVQEVLLKAFRQWGTIGHYDKPGAWIRRVVVRDSISNVRRAKAELRALTQLRRRHRDVEDVSVEVLAFWDAVRTLGPDRQKVVALRVAGDLTIDDIADTLDMQPNTVKSHLRRAREALRDLPAADTCLTHVPEELP